ncbi:MAG: hypothetical protein AB8G18_04975 [Gammaproteobacteria bacterium]
MLGKHVCKAASMGRVLAVLLLVTMGFAPLAQATDTVTTYKDEQGWKLQVNGEDFYVKGVVWGYTPRNQNYSYNLWGYSDEHIRKVLDYDFGLMKAAGINAIRSFAMLPPKWITYIYREHGIMTVVNPLMGRYGYTVGGRWIPNTDYSDELTRATLIKDMLEVVNKYKDVPGVLMFAFGNESNYQLSWSSFEIENLPVGEREAGKARYLYSLFAEVIRGGKKIDSNHPFTIVNGDIQYLDLIAEYLKDDMDLLGSNVYRGVSFTDMWERVDQKLDMPLVFFEFGSDAFNAREFQEDQAAQANVLKLQWQEMYNKSYGNGEEGNSIGGFVFEWRDEWWKYLQTENLDKQDNNASWSNQAYLFDWAEGQNNMNEEWFGIAALGKRNSDGVYTARPRMAYDVLSEIWAMDPYALKKSSFNQSMENINMELLELKGEVRLLKSENKENKQKLTFTGGSLIGELVVKGTEQDIDINGQNGLEFEDGQMMFLDFGFQPNDNIEGQFTLNILGNVADKEPLEIQYGRRGLPLVFRADILAANELIPGQDFQQRILTFNDRERIEIYDFSATVEGENFDMEAFYHTPRFHWGYEGDFFGLLHEATDMAGMDIWNAKAPEGVEFTGKGKFEGLKILAGPEVHWGANPKVMLKYERRLGKTDVAVIHSQDIARQGESASATAATLRQSRQSTLYLDRKFNNGMRLELGGIVASTEEIDEEFVRVDDNTVFIDEVEFKDTLGAKAKFSFPVLGALGYVSGKYSGLVADAGLPLREFGTQLPFTEAGNKVEYEAGVMINSGYWMVFPRILYRDNLVHGNPIIESSVTPDGFLNPGATPRDTDSDPFAVLGNREARAAELMITYDPTGATPFYDWDNDLREDAKFAFNIGLNYTNFPTATDANLFFFEPTGTNGSFGIGLPAEEVWSASSRIVYNPNINAKYIARIMAGKQQSTGDPNGGTREFFELHGRAVYGGKHTLSGYIKKDGFGPYDFHRQFNITFPEQIQLDYSVVLDGSGDQFGTTVGNATRVGIRTLYRSADENSPIDEFRDGENDYIFQTVFYFSYLF